MKEITQAFMGVLISANVQEINVKALVELLWENPEGMDEVVAFIKENPTATESNIMRKAIEVSKNRYFTGLRRGKQ